MGHAADGDAAAALLQVGQDSARQGRAPDAGNGGISSCCKHQREDIGSETPAKLAGTVARKVPGPFWRL